MSNIGDVNSDARGSGARYNAGKVPLELIPLRVIAEMAYPMCDGAPATIDALYSLAKFQEGGDATDLQWAIKHIGPAWDECAAVFDYGRQKYAEWNWAKGMAWSIPIACAARHIVYGIFEGESIDPESGLSHRGHFLCNIVMLLTYLRTFPDGDDRPTKWLGDLADRKIDPDTGFQSIGTFRAEDGYAVNAYRETDRQRLVELRGCEDLKPNYRAAGDRNADREVLASRLRKNAGLE